MNKDCFFNDENEFCTYYKTSLIPSPVCQECRAYVNKEKAHKLIVDIVDGRLFDKEEDDLK